MDLPLTPRFGEIPELTEINRLPARRESTPLPEEGSDSPWVLSLDGEWTFDYFEKPEEVDPSLVNPESDLTDKATVTVPGNWTVQGYDKPHYTNHQMPFRNDPPRVPEANPTGLYRKWFSCPKDWENRRKKRAHGAHHRFLPFVLPASGLWVFLLP